MESQASGDLCSLGHACLCGWSSCLLVACAMLDSVAEWKSTSALWNNTERIYFIIPRLVLYIFEGGCVSL